MVKGRVSLDSRIDCPLEDKTPVPKFRYVTSLKMYFKQKQVAFE